CFQAEVRFPELAVVDIFNPFPNARLAAMLVPVRTEMPVVEAEHLRSKPSGHVDAIRDVADRDAVLGLAGEQPGPHGSRNLSVESRNGVRAPCNSQTEYGHAERFPGVVGILPPQSHQAVVR